MRIFVFTAIAALLFALAPSTGIAQSQVKKGKSYGFKPAKAKVCVPDFAKSRSNPFKGKACRI